MTSQKIEQIIFKEFEENKQHQKVKTHNSKITIQNSQPQNPNSWTSQVVSVLNISDIARDNNISECPLCSYSLYFDDSRGFFICCKARFERGCDFSGNIVDFVKFTEEGRW